MALNPQVEALLALFAQMPQFDLDTVTPEQFRASADARGLPVPPPEVAEVQDLTLDLPGRSIPARLYRPAGAGGGLTVYFHGGGWVVGTIDTHDPTCRALALASGHAVLSVGYRLAPECPFPGPLDDCYDATVWARDHAASLGIDGTRLAVAGDSAGGNLAAAVAIRARDEQGPAIRHQLLIYPVADADFTRPSYVANGSGDYFLSTATMIWFWRHYVGDRLGNHIPGATLVTTPNLANLPPAHVVVAEYDPLLDEGVALAQALQAAGNAVELVHAPGMIHGFFSMFQAVPDAMPFIEAAGARLKEAFA